MADNAFLDKGIVLGFCFFTDPHHRECRKYLFSGETEYFATEQVENIFRNAKEAIIKKHRSGVLQNIKQVKLDYEGELTESDVEEIRSDIDRRENSAWRYLEDFYQDKAGREVYEVTEELREIIREMEQRSEERKEKLYSTFQGWLRFSSHESVQANLTRLRAQDEEDFWIVIDAHDVASSVAGKTELATTNPAEFADESIQEEVLGATAIDSIQLVFVSRDYSPSPLEHDSVEGDSADAVEDD